MMQKRTVARWAEWNQAGLDHCLFVRDRKGLGLDGLAIGESAAFSFAARYKVQTDAALRTRDVVVRFVGGPDLWLVSDGKGNWVNGSTGVTIEGLTGCLDVDIAATPATNTLPILRLGLTVGESADIVVAYLPLTDGFDAAIDPIAARQRYTRLGHDRYRYESLTSGFTSEIDVDQNSVVKDYPRAFRRVWLHGAPGELR